MKGTGDMFVASDIAFGGSRVAFSRFAASVAGCTPFRDGSRGQNSSPMLTQILILGAIGDVKVHLFWMV
eukprot:7209359-Prymnesium_polylepis.1